MGISLSKHGVEDVGQTILIRKIGTNDNSDDAKVTKVFEKRIQVYDENFPYETSSLNRPQSFSTNNLTSSDVKEVNFEDKNGPISEKSLNFGLEKYFNDKKVFFNGISEVKNGEIDNSSQLNHSKNRVILEEHKNLIEVKIILNELINEVCYGMESKNDIQLLDTSLSHSDKEDSLKMEPCFEVKAVLDELINEICDLNNEVLDGRNSHVYICDCPKTEETYNQIEIKAFLDTVLNEACNRLRNDTSFTLEDSEIERVHEDFEIKVILNELVDKICVLDAEIGDKEIQSPLENNNDEIETWRILINSLQNNQTLTSYARSKRRDQFESIKKLSEFLLDFKCDNDYEKAWLIYVWITDNIEYNLIGYASGNYGKNDTANVLASGKCVCAGYSNLFEELSQAMGLECRSILGYSKAFSYTLGQKLDRKPNHEWNSIKIDGKWFNVEATWGAGYGDWATQSFVKRFEPFWFLTPPELFMYKHFFEKQCQSDEKIYGGVLICLYMTFNQVIFFLFKKKRLPSSLEEFEQMPLLQLGFQFNGLRIDSPHTATRCSLISTIQNPLIIEIASSNKQTLLMACLKDVSDKYSTLVERDSLSLKYRVICFLPEPQRHYELQLFAKNSQQTNEEFECVAQYLVKCETNEILMNETISKYSLEFEFGLKCLTHFTRVIHTRTNLVEIEFLAQKSLSLLGKLKDNSGKIYENSVLIQETLYGCDGEKIFKIKIALPSNTNHFYNFLFYACDNQSTNQKHEWAGEFVLRTNYNDNDQKEKKFVKTYINNLDTYIHSPIDYSLNAEQTYEFRYYIKNALEVALVDANDKWHYLTLENSSIFLWSKEISFDTHGDLCLYAKFDEDAEFDGICSYEVVRIINGKE